MLSDSVVVLYWIVITIILIQLGQLSCFTIFTKPRSGLSRNKISLKAAKNEIEKPLNFIEEKNIEQSLFNPPPKSKKMMNQRGVITEVEDVIVNLAPGGCQPVVIDIVILIATSYTWPFIEMIFQLSSVTLILHSRLSWLKNRRQNSFV